jgi:thioredoxin reductase (NADPH)
MKDAIIIGYGPAGVSAALYLRRSGMQVTLIGKDTGSLARAEKIENYFGLAQPLSGAELAAIGIAQARALGAEVVTDEVLDLGWDNNYTIRTKNGQYSSRAVILATGSARKTLPVPGLAAREGRGVAYCAVCDGFFYRGKSVGVLGAGEFALHEVSHLLPIAESVTLLTHGAPAPENPPEGLKVETRPLAEVFGEPAVEGVRFEGGDTLALSGLFVALGSAAAADFARKTGAEIDGNRIVVDEEMRTAVPGLFAAGDCTGGLMQVSVAVAKGARAAMSALDFLRKH